MALTAIRSYKTITEFGFRTMCRIMRISGDVIHLGLQPRWITSSQIWIILHILLSLTQVSSFQSPSSYNLNVSIKERKKKKPNLAVVQIDVHSPFVFNMSEVWSTDENVCKPVTKTGPILLLCDKNKKMREMSRIRSRLTLEASTQVYTSLLQLLFDYVDVTWGEISEGCCKELQCQQNRAAQKTLSVCLNQLNLASRTKKMHKCIVVFKCLNNLELKYLVQYFTRNGDLHNHATRRRKDLHPPKPKRNMGKRTFKYEGAIDFNSSPSCVKSATSLNSF